jgi:hypothetical protein
MLKQTDTGLFVLPEFSTFKIPRVFNHLTEVLAPVEFQNCFGIRYLFGENRILCFCASSVYYYFYTSLQLFLCSYIITSSLPS